MEQGDNHAYDLGVNILILLIVALLVPIVGIGQQSRHQFQKRKKKIRPLRKLLQKQNNAKGKANDDGGNSPQSYSVNYNSLSQDYTIFEQDQSWNHNPNSNPQYNFRIYGQGQPAGDINGDGKDDFIVTGVARDERTSMLEDQIGKTAVYYGGNTSTDPDQLVYATLIPVGDLNGDGYADAVRPIPQYDFPSASETYATIYKGTANGYKKTSKNLYSGFGSDYDQFGFTDFDGDGYEDILCYNASSGGSASIYYGAPFSDMLSGPTSLSGLNYGPKRLVVGNIDTDPMQEIVEFSGSYGDGQVAVFQVDTTQDGYLEQQQNFAFTNFSYPAADKLSLNLIDANGDGYEDIYISTVSPQNNSYEEHKYIFPYDTTNQQISSSPTVVSQVTSLHTGNELYPVGDLNGNQITDFVGKDSADAYKAHLYLDLLNPDSAKVINLQGNTSTDWDWSMQYNAYGRFGDLNGDGLDDALVYHSEQNAGTFYYGRRILSSSTSGTANSVFQQYDTNNYFSYVEETEAIGDINGDGMEDFAVNFNNQKKTEIFFGDSTLSQTPDMVLNLDFYPLGMTSGDFNGDGASDLLISGHTQSDAKIAAFYGGTNFDANADYSVKASDFENVSNPEFLHVQNVGDVNADSTDDFFIGSGSANDQQKSGLHYLNEGYLFFGGSSLPSSPDATISLSSDTTYIWAGESSTALGDINEDGIDDFAVACSYARNGSESTSAGNVQVFYGGSNKTFDSPDKTITPERIAFGFGYRIAAGDFSGDGVNDLAVGVNQTRSSEMGDPPALVYIYNGGAGMDANADQFLNIPAEILSGKSSQGTESSLIKSTFSDLQTIPDFNNDGKDELLMTTSPFGSPKHTNAALFTFNTGKSEPSAVFKAPNQDASLGGRINEAVGDFNGDGELDVILSQYLDNNDAYQSSRFYRYGLTTPLKITSVEDVPDDQGGWVRVHAGGYLMDAMNQDIYGLDNWGIWRMTTDSSWTNVATVQPFSGGARYVDVHVPKTQPSNVDSVDVSYTFKIVAYRNNGVIAETDTLSGKALDNLAPGQVQGLQVQGQSNPKIKLKSVSRTLSWNTLDANDVSAYQVYSLDADGNLSQKPVGSSTSTNFALPDSMDGVQNFAVRAKDNHNNLGKASSPASAIYPKTIHYDETEGWNLMSFPLNADLSVLTQMVKDSSSAPIYEYNGSYQKVDQLQAGKGYWVKMPKDEHFKIRKIPSTKITLDLNKGWNLISGVGGNLPLSKISDPDGIVIDSTTYAFSAAYMLSDTLRPGMGYWVRVSKDGSVTFTHPKMITGKAKIKDKAGNSFADKAQDINDTFDNVIISDGRHSQKLLFGQKLPQGVNKLSYSLPPLPPGNIFDARFKGDKRLVEDDEMYIQLNNPGKSPLNIKINVQSLAERSRFTIKEFSDGKLLNQYKIEANKDVELSSSKTDAIYVAPVSGKLAQEEKPTEFELQQNYPNPFNPTTQIKYSVPKTAKVKLEVFNILGKRVATLINKEQKSGRHQVTFDGSNLASGMYIYRLQAGSQVMTKKLILAK